ncbi:hypothetical protein CAEBREN_24756 [Caenorhabditis brenneri]|uniref:Uncharacterized protein n=1 Tax=Caenorhabditis brenneri TaxID=135651 RepID=G0P1Y1_CAEBE|nr:hypothetical protein CAEBREN_24756 [Caenorhabditis brenneri]
MPPYTLLILLLPVLKGCLVVRTPKCECPVLALSSTNIAQNVGNHEFYQNVSGYSLASPVVVLEDCSVSMYCEGEYSLVVFDTDTATGPDTTFACNPTEQTWEVQALGQPPLGREVDFLGVGCYEIGTCNPEIPCQYKTFDKLSDLKDHFEYKAISQFYSYKAPVVTIDGCSLTMTCDGNYTLIHLDYFDIYSFEKTSVSAQCLIGWLWRYPEMETGEFYGICVDLSSKRTTRTPPFATTTPQNKILSRLR